MGAYASRLEREFAETQNTELQRQFQKLCLVSFHSAGPEPFGYDSAPFSDRPIFFPVRIVSFNADRFRSAARKGFFRWFARQRADVLCVQELKAHDHQLADRAFESRGFHRVLHAAQKPGYSGVAIYSRGEPAEVVRGIGVPEFDAEGRYVEAHFGSVAIASAYFPSGSSSPARQE